MGKNEKQGETIENAAEKVAAGAAADNDKFEKLRAKGKQLGGDKAATWKWEESNRILGTLVSSVVAKTQHGTRTRVVLSREGEEIGVWLPERWHTSFEPFLGKQHVEVGIERIVKGVQVKGYEVFVEAPR